MLHSVQDNNICMYSAFICRVFDFDTSSVKCPGIRYVEQLNIFTTWLSSSLFISRINFWHQTILCIHLYLIIMLSSQNCPVCWMEPVTTNACCQTLIHLTYCTQDLKKLKGICSLLRIIFFMLWYIIKWPIKTVKQSIHLLWSSIGVISH